MTTVTMGQNYPQDPNYSQQPPSNPPGWYGPGASGPPAQGPGYGQPPAPGYGQGYGHPLAPGYEQGTGQPFQPEPRQGPEQAPVPGRQQPPQQPPQQGPGQASNDRSGSEQTQEAPAERSAASLSGVPWLLMTVLLGLATVASFILAVSATPVLWVLFVILLLAFFLFWSGLYVLQPNQAAVLTLFGDYRGTDRAPGLRFNNPLLANEKVSLRVRNFNTSSSKVNDANGNPIHIAAVVVWQVVETASATFGVDDFSNYVAVQSESAVRQMARAYPYESFDDPEATTLIGEPDAVNRRLLTELQERANAAGVRIIEARVTDLSYAAEVADSMLRRQQAAAIVAGRTKIVEGAVGMVHQALRELEEGAGDGEPVRMEGARRASFAANLMTVLASDTPTNPVVNVGSDTSG